MTEIDGAWGVAKALGYVRVSTTEQAESGAGQEAQRWALDRECKHRGWELLKVYEDVYSAATVKKRPELNEALDRLDRGEATVLVASKLDRLIRSALDFHLLIERAKKNGWRLVVLDLGMDTATPMGEAMAGMAAVFAQLERRRIGERTKEALAAKRRAGTLKGPIGRPPGVVGEVFDRIKAERDAGKSLQEIADMLTAERVPTVRGGEVWRKSTVHDALRSVRAAAPNQ